MSVDIASVHDANTFLADCICTMRSVCVSTTPLPVTSCFMRRSRSGEVASAIVAAYASLPSPRSLVCEVGVALAEPRNQSFPWMRSSPCRVVRDEPIGQLEVVMDGSVCCAVSASRRRLMLWSVVDDEAPEDGGGGGASLFPIPGNVKGKSLYIRRWNIEQEGSGLLMYRQISDICGIAEFLRPENIVHLQQAGAVSDGTNVTPKIYCGALVAAEATGDTATLVEDRAIGLVDLRCSESLPVDRFAFSPDQLLVTSAVVLNASAAPLVVCCCEGSCSLLLFDLRMTNQHVTIISSTSVHSAAAVRAECSTSDGEGVVLIGGEQVALLNPKRSDPEFCFSGHAADVLCCCVAGEDTYLSSSTDGTIALWTHRR